MRPFVHIARQIMRRVRGNKHKYESLIEVTISRDAILHNLRIFKEQHPGVGIAPVLKSNAYGHGLKEVGAILASEHVPFLCVDSFFEALTLRNEGVRSPILVIGYTPIENVVRNTLHDIAFCVIGLDDLREIAQHIQASTKIHIEIDTGMHRHGIQPEEIKTAATLVRSNTHIQLEGVYSHLADADAPDSAHTAAQIERWNAVAGEVHAEFPDIRYIHCAATAGSTHLPEMVGNVMRLGIGLYGINVTTGTLDLHPALLMQTRITSLRELAAGEYVGYNATFETTAPTHIASIPAGYSEGIDRRLSNNGFVSVRGTPCPIVGMVSMNITSIDVSAVPEVKTKDTVIVISRNPADSNSVEQIARQCGTIPYEILVHIPAHLRRRIV
ncbi:MAG: alanine racemase [Candidatus Paceibacterota bacterium]